MPNSEGDLMELSIGSDHADQSPHCCKVKIVLSVKVFFERAED